MGDADGSTAGEPQAALLAAVMAVADGLDLNETLHRIVTTAVDLVDARYGALGVLDVEGRVTQFVHVGIDDAEAERIGPLPSGRGILGLLSELSGPLRLPDLTAHERSAGFPAGHPPMRSFLGVPIRVRDHAYGNLYLTEKRTGEFTAADESLVEALAAAAGVAIGNARLFHRSRRRQSWQQAVTAVDTLVLAQASDDDIALEIASQAGQLASAEVAVLAIPDEDGELLVDRVVVADDEDRTRWSVAYSRLAADSQRYAGEVAKLAGTPVPRGSAIDRAFRDGVAVAGEQPLLNSDVPDVFGPSLVLPLRARDRVLGVVALRRLATEPPFDPEVTELAEAFATQVALALSFGLERRERERLAVFEERDRIARDLHDLVIQRLFATGMMLEGASRLAELPPVLADRIRVAVDELDGTIKEIRTTIFDLHDGSSAPSWVSVRARVLAEVERAGAGVSPKPTLSFEGPVDALVRDDVAGHLVAAVREGLSNAARHAGGPGVRVRVRVAAGDGEVLLTVTDDGRGLPGEVSRHSGLLNLAERAAALGGVCEVVPGPNGRGTELRWRAPL